MRRLIMGSVLLATATTAHGQRSVLESPSVRSIIARPDTIWFCADLPNTGRALYAFARQTRTWSSSPDLTVCGPASGRPDPQSVTALGQGVVSRIMNPSPDGSGRSFLLVTDSARKRASVIKPALDAAKLRRIAGRDEQFESDTISPNVTASAVTDSTIWIGLEGRFGEGTGVFGGIYRIDRATGTWEWIITPALADHSVSGLRVIGNSLWVATHAEESRSGLLQMDLHSKTWKAYTDSTSPLPSSALNGMATDGSTLALSADDGLAVIELREGSDQIARWNVSYFTPAFAGDSMRFDISTARHIAAGAEAAWAIVQRTGPVGKEKPLWDVLVKLPETALVNVATSDDDSDFGGGLLADTAAADAYVIMLGSPRWYAKQLAAEAITALGRNTPQRAIAALRRAFFSDTTHEGREARVVIGQALGAVADSETTTWALSTMEQTVRSTPSGARATGLALEDLTVAVTAMEKLRDPRGLSLLMAVAPITPDNERYHVIDALAAYDSPLAWGAIVAYARAGLLPVEAVIPRLKESALTDAIVGGRVRQLVRDEIVSGKNPQYAAEAAMRLRLVEMVPPIVARLEPFVGRESWNMLRYYQALISLTGRPDAPIFQKTFTADAYAFWKNVVSSNLQLAAVPAKDGEKAWFDWERRRRTGG